jgi:hypothetical protein
LIAWLRENSCYGFDVCGMLLVGTESGQSQSDRIEIVHCWYFVQWWSEWQKKDPKELKKTDNTSQSDWNQLMVSGSLSYHRNLGCLQHYTWSTVKLS